MSKRISKSSQKFSKHHNNQRRKTQFPYEIAVISELGPEAVRDGTLVQLKKYRIPADKITVWTTLPGQEKHYMNVLAPGTFARIFSNPSNCISDFYNCISNTYLPGTRILFIKDTVTDWIEYDERSITRVRPLKSLLALLKTGFSECERLGCTLWGIYPVAMPSYLQPTMTTELKYISGDLWGCINPGPMLQLQFSLYEDYERSILYYKRDGCILRLNMVAGITAEDDGAEKQSGKVARRLLEKYPEFVTLQPYKNAGFLQIRLRDLSKEANV
jgi:hypothetical protein